MSHDFAGTAHDLTLTYGYNPAGQITGRTASNDAYSHTGVANQNVSDTHNGLNQIVTAGLTGVTHDGRGNTVAIGSAGYTYTADNRMVTSGGSSFYHDMLGRMAHSSGPGLNFLYDIGGGQMIGEQGSAGVTAVHVPGPGADEQLMTWEPSSGALTHLHADERGSIIATSDGSGNVLRSTAMTNMARRRGRAGPAPRREGSAIPARPGCPSWECTTTRPASTIQGSWAAPGSCSRIRSAMGTG
jgi:hypothetical protein